MRALSVTIYGIKNGDTMKKAHAWLDQHGVDYAPSASNYSVEILSFVAPA